MPQQIVTPVGRIVWGHPTKGQQRTDDNNNPIIGNDGQPSTEFVFGLAIPKGQEAELFAAMGQEAATTCGGQPPQNFAWKFKDGDSPDLNTREGHAGHFIFTIATVIAPRVVQNQGGQWVDFADVKRGDYVRVALSIKGHTGNPQKKGSKPGLYLNPAMVEFIGYGQEIFSGPSADQVFAGVAPAQLPPGASATPIASATPMPAMPTAAPVAPAAPAMPTAPVAAPMPAAAPIPQAAPIPGAPAPTVPAGVPQAAPVAAPGQPIASPTNPAVQPAHDFVQNAVAGVPVPGQG